MKKGIRRKKATPAMATGDYLGLLSGVRELFEAARRASARTVNAFMTATYWEIGRRIVEFEQGGEKRAGYGDELLKRLSQDLSAHCGRGFSRQNLQNMRQFYLSVPPDRICQMLPGKLGETQKCQTVSGISETKPPKLEQPLEQQSSPPFALAELARTFPLPWSHYVMLIHCSSKGESLVRYATDALSSKMLVREYMTALPDEKTLAAEIERTRRILESRT